MSLCRTSSSSQVAGDGGGRTSEQLLQCSEVRGRCELGWSGWRPGGGLELPFRTRRGEGRGDRMLFSEGQAVWILFPASETAPHWALGIHSVLSLFQLGSSSGHCCQEKESCLGTLVTPRETLERERHLRRKPWGAGSPCLEELSGLNLTCSHKFIARVRAGHCWSPFPACPGLVFSLCPSTQKLLKASGGTYPIYPQGP